MYFDTTMFASSTVCSAPASRAAKASVADDMTTKPVLPGRTRNFERSGYPLRMSWHTNTCSTVPNCEKCSVMILSDFTPSLPIRLVDKIRSVSNLASFRMFAFSELSTVGACSSSSTGTSRVASL